MVEKGIKNWLLMLMPYEVPDEEEDAYGLPHYIY